MQKPSSLTITDQFCGAGGTSLAATQAGAEVKLALNHWKLAVESHNTNFPNTWHDCTDISACDPRRYPSTTILLTSPECTSHSLAKGKKRKNLGELTLWGLPKIDPAEERSRATMLDVPRFAEFHQYELIIVENVVDAHRWILFDEWLRMMQKLGYQWEIVYFNSMFAHPTPQSRDRMYIVFWKKGNRAPDLRFTPPAYCIRCGKQIEAVQVWKKPNCPWGRYGSRYGQYLYGCPLCQREVVPFYYAAANVIDWSLPIQRIGDRKKPLEEKTIRRIELGLRKFQVQEDLLLQVNTGGSDLVSPFLVGLSYGSDSGRVTSVTESAMQTQTTRQDQALVVPYILDLTWEYRPRSIMGPLTTVVAGGNHHGLVLSPPVSTSFLSTYNGNGGLHPLFKPAGTITTLDRHALLTPSPSSVRVEDCSFRMLQPSEISRAMAFPEEYVVLGNARQKVKQYGNAVTPPVMKMILERCIQTLQ